jgi:competence protein ComEA
MTTSFLKTRSFKVSSPKLASLKAAVVALVLGLMLSPLSMAESSATQQKAKSAKYDKAAKQMESRTAVIDINTATASELSTLINIGMKKAKEIVAYREAHGNFISIDGLIKVKGIGSNTVEQNRRRIQVAKK